MVCVCNNQSGLVRASNMWAETWGKRGLNSSILVDIGLGLFSVGSNIGSEGIRERLPTTSKE